MIEIIFQGLPKSPNELNKMHWAVRRRQSQIWRTMSCLLFQKKRPTEPYNKIKIKIDRYSYKIIDRDNGIAAVKPIIDGIVDAKIIPDDNSHIIAAIDFEWHYAPKNKGFLKIMVEPLE